MSHLPNRIVHLELGVTDLTEAVKFYKQVFPGWKIKRAEHIPDYYFFNYGLDEEVFSGGISLVDQLSSGSIIFYVQVDDIPTTLSTITQAGGKVLLEKSPLPGEEGYIGRFEDPSGNMLGIWSQT